MLKRFGTAIVITLLIFFTIGCDCDQWPQDQELDSHINNLLQTKHIPGLSAAIVANGQVAWSKGYGYANVETKQPMTACTPFFEIASVTKLITGTALMIALEENSEWDLDSEIKLILQEKQDPEKAFTVDAPFEVDTDVSSEDPQITLRHLTSHTSGITDSDAYICSLYVGDASKEYQKLADIPEYEIEYICPENSPVDLEGFLASYLDKDGMFYSRTDNFMSYVPGKRYHYSNIAAALEGYLAGLIAGTSLDKYTMERIFQPLKMHHTSWHYSDLCSRKLAAPYWFEDQEFVPLPLYSWATWPDGGLKTNANDLARFLAAIINGGTLNGKTILTKDSVVEMLDLQLIQIADSEEQIPTGVHWTGNRLADDRRVVGHEGEDPGVMSYLFFDYDKYVNHEGSIGVILLINRDEFDDDEFIYNLLDLLFKKAEKL